MNRGGHACVWAKVARFSTSASLEQLRHVYLVPCHAMPQSYVRRALHPFLVYSETCRLRYLHLVLCPGTLCCAVEVGRQTQWNSTKTRPLLRFVAGKATCSQRLSTLQVPSVERRVCGEESSVGGSDRRPPRCVAEPPPPPPIPCSLRTLNGFTQFHSLQVGQRPTHCTCSEPQTSHTCTYETIGGEYRTSSSKDPIPSTPPSSYTTSKPLTRDDFAGKSE